MTIESTPGPLPSKGKSSAGTQPKQGPVKQKVADERREGYIMPRRLIKPFRFERGTEPRPDVNMSLDKLASPATVNSSTAWGQPDLHTDARGRAYGPPEGGKPTSRRKFSQLAQDSYLMSQPLPDAAQLASVYRIGDERSRPATGAYTSQQQTWRRYHQRHLSKWRMTRHQPVKQRLKGIGK